MDDLLDIDCPRCGRAVRARFHGPCDSCRSDLRAGFQREGRDVEVAAYEPKVNVVANQIASKD